MQDFLSAWYNRPTAILAWSFSLILWGIWTVAHIPLEWVPQVELPALHLNAAYSGANPRAVERYVTSPLERAVQDITGTVSVESISQEGSAFITLNISEDTDPALYAAEVNERLALVKPTLPEGVVPYLSKEIPEALREQQGFMTLQVVGNLLPDALRSLADERIAPKLRALSGIGHVAVSGGTARELRLVLHPERLSAYHIAPEQVQAVLKESLDDAVYGRLRSQGRAILLLSPAEQTVRRLEDLMIPTMPVVTPEGVQGVPKSIPLHELATLTLGPAPVESVSRIDGQAVVTLSLDRGQGSHLLETAKSVKASLEALKSKLPKDVRVLVADDRSESIQLQLQQLAWQGSIGMVLVVLVLLFMLKSLRAVAVVLFSVLLALSIAFLLLRPLGLTLNLVTLGGLVLVFGLLVDNAVVVAEEWMRVRKKQMSVVETVQKVLTVVWLPLLGGTLTTIIVIVPLVYLSGALRALFLPFGILTALTLLVSLASAVLVVPVLGRFLPYQEDEVGNRWVRRWVNAPFRWVSRAPRFTILVLILLLGTPFWLLPRSFSISSIEREQDAQQDAQQNVPSKAIEEAKIRLKTLYNDTIGADVVQELREWLDPYLGGVARPFFETTNFGQSWKFNPEPEVFVSMQFPPGNPIARADSLIHEFEKVALAAKGVKSTIVQASERSVSLQVKFKEKALDTSEPFIVREDLIQQAVLLAGIDVSVSGLLPQGYYSASGTDISGMQVDAFGPNYEDLAILASRFSDKLKQNARVAAVNTDANQYGRNSSRTFLRYEWNADAQMRTGVSPASLASALRPIFATRFPVAYADLEDETRLPIRIEMGDLHRTDIARLAEMPLPVTQAKSISLGKTADFQVEEMASDIERANQQYKRHLVIDFRGPYELGYEFLKGELAAMPVPAGYRLEMSQMSFFTDEVKTSFWGALLATIGLVYLVLVFVLESWKMPWVVLASVPMAFIGMALAFVWREANFAEGAFIGSVLLVGIAVNNSILLVDRYQVLLREHPLKRKKMLIRLAVRARLRPMWATTLTSVAGMLPVLLAPETNEFWLGLSATMTGGLLGSTLLIPFVTTALLGRKEVITHSTSPISVVA
jgi:multidrug efflux pump subunit AcrB